MTPTTLAERIDKAAADGAITAARSRRAHENIRVLGNDVLHDEWREVTEAEFDQAHDSTSVKAPAISSQMAAFASSDCALLPPSFTPRLAASVRA